ncbi:hypothetical protein NA57DRAFT_70600 [Rhizodiscina lignyota]|uniref:Uncharacterized protein n=1 Tax=Rhizodiscina lignyota TaxID=1504668 RepID=A0A9P4IS63_9PEZI|nr:hypothetical protein NA57DRAFT_70600 [Rhizodiscina lignyota]
MSAIIRRTAFRPAFRTVRPVRYASGANPGVTGAEREEGKSAVRTGAKRDPELYILFTIMCGVFGLAGWHFSRNPTTASSEANTNRVPGSEPWKSGGEGKYQYHPGGDTSHKKDAPSALNVVIVPNVNLPKELHEKYNKWGKEGYP